MKYTVEVKKDKVIETLEVKGKKYTKNIKIDPNWVIDYDEPDFYECLKKQGFNNHIVNRVADVIDGSCLGTELLEIYKEMEAN